MAPNRKARFEAMMAKAEKQSEDFEARLDEWEEKNESSL